MSPLESIRRFSPIALSARWDKGSIEGRFFFGVACNAPYFSGGLHFSANSRANDGQLDVCLVPVMPKWVLAAWMAWGRLGRRISNRRVIHLRTAALEIRSEADLWPQADGEPAAPEGMRRVTFAVGPEKAMIVLPEKPGSIALYP